MAKANIQAKRLSNAKDGAGEAREDEAVEANPEGALSGSNTGRIGTVGNSKNDPMVGALVHVAEYFGNRVSPETVTYGLPMPGGRIPLDRIDDAAAQAGLNIDRVRRRSFVGADFAAPALLLLDNGDVCVVQKISPEDKTAEAVIFPALGGGAVSESLPVADLHRRSGGKAIIARPKPRLTGVEDIGRKSNEWFWSAFRPSRGLYGQILAVTLFANLMALAVPLFIMNVYDRVVPNGAIDTLWALAIGVLFAALLDFLLRTIRAYLIDVAGRRADIDLATRLHSRVIGARLETRSKSSGAQANVMREYETVRDFFTSATLATFGDMLFIFLFIAVIWMVGGRLALVPAIIVPTVLLIALATQIPLSRIAQRSFQQAAQKNSVLFETLGGLETIKSIGAENWAADQWERSISETIRTSTKMRLFTAINVNLVAAAQIVATVFIVVMGVYDIADGVLSAGALIAVVILSGRVVAPLGQVAAVLAKLYQAVIAFRAVAKLMHAPQERERPTPFIDLRTVEGGIEFDSVEFVYPDDDRNALNRASFKIEPGEKVGLVGPIGSGKSTILRLCLGLYRPRHGLVLVDGIDLAELDPAVVRANVGYVAQNAQLFRGTVRQNITLHAPQATDAMLMEAARISGAADWLRRSPKGLDTPVGERGDELSGGQRQSIALARALLREPKILLLDEPTSGLDRATEHRLLERVKQGAKDRTVLIVSHSPTVLSMVDRLIVIENGGVTMDGPKEKVLQAIAARQSKQT